MLVSRSPQASTEQRVAPGGPSLPTDGHGPAHSGEPATGLSDLLSLWAPRGRRPPPGSWEATCDSSPAESAAALQQMSPSRSSDGDWERVEGPAPDQQRAGPHRRPPPPTAAPARPEAEAPPASLCPRWIFILCRDERVRQPMLAGGSPGKRSCRLQPPGLLRVPASGVPRSPGWSRVTPRAHSRSVCRDASVSTEPHGQPAQAAPPLSLEARHRAAFHRAR